MDELFMIFPIIFVFTYFIIFYVVFINANMKKKKRIRFHNAVISIHKENTNADEAIEQLTLNFNKLTENIGISKEKTLLDMLELLVYYYDTYDDDRFKNIFSAEKDVNIRNYIYLICKTIKDKDPFSNVSTKEATMLNNINDALSKNNVDLGKVSLKQLAKEISNKDVEYKKMEKQNVIATTVSIIGVILTIIFGIPTLFN